MADKATKDKVLEEVEDLVLEEVRKVIRKGEINTDEWDNFKKAICIWSECCNIKRGMYDDNMYDSGYSGRTYRIPSISYGVDGTPMYNQVGEGMSHERGRSSVTGRYISRGHDGGYSGHSIDDRAIASLERLYDNAQSQHEKERLDSIIRCIRTDEL